MTAPPPTATNYGELYSSPACNPFGTEDEAVLRGYLAMDSLWRATHDPLSVEALHQNILADFCRPIGAIGVFVQDDESGTSRLKLPHGIHSFPGSGCSALPADAGPARSQGGSGIMSQQDPADRQASFEWQAAHEKPSGRVPSYDHRRSQAHFPNEFQGTHTV
jgi:hypothetical protein